MRRDVVLASLWVASGCSVASSSTVPHVRFGYDRPVRIALASDGDKRLLDGWRVAMRDEGTVEIASETASESASETASETKQQAHRRMCRTGVALARAGRPVDLVVELSSSLGATPNFRCANFSRTIGNIIDDKEGTCGRATYVSTTAIANSVVRIVDATTCTAIREHIVASEPQTAKVNEREDEAIARENATRRHLTDLRAAVSEELFPRGLAIVGVNGRTIEVSRHGDTKLAPGAVYVLRTAEMITPNRRDTLVAPRMRVASLSEDRATLEVERDFVGARAGDQLRAHRRDYLWTLYGAPIGTIARDNTGTYAGYAFVGAFRAAPARLPVFAELEFGAGVVPVLATSYLGGGVSLGARVPMGRFAPIALVEAGGLTANQRDLSDRAAFSTRGYLGGGLGVELWLGSLFVFVDARYRRLAGGEWVTVDGEMPTDVARSFGRLDILQLRIAAGYRF